MKRQYVNKTYYQRGDVRPRSPAEILEPKKAPRSPNSNQASHSSLFIKRCMHIINFIFSFLFILMLYSGITIKIITAYYDAPGPLRSNKIVEIEKGLGRFDIIRKLENQGVISNSGIFIINNILLNSSPKSKAQDFKAGEYEFSKAVSMREVWDTITAGKVALYKITLPEGLTSQQIVDRLNSETILSGEIKKIPEEGSLMPDTYLISRGTPRQELLNRMQSEQIKFIEKNWKDREKDLPVINTVEAIVLASIVEKETGKDEERDRVAAVFINRLKKKMRLQSDPTIIYGLVGGLGSLGRPLTHNDVESKTAYNTYQVNGLPPGPICNPGKSAILATLHPAKSNDLYFVADGTGGHTFSSSLNEHNSAVQVWRKISKDNQAELNTVDKTGGGSQQKSPINPDNISNEPESIKPNSSINNSNTLMLLNGQSQKTLSTSSVPKN